MTWNAPLPPQPPTLTGHFAYISKSLLDTVYACSLHGGFLTHAMWVILSGWIFKHIVRIRVLLAALQDGTVRTRKSPAPGLTRTRAAPAPDAEVPAWVLPRNFAWLRIMLATRGRNCLIPAGPLEALMAEPEMLALLAASPRLVRTMRPLCRALGVQMPKFARPVPPAPVSPVAVADSHAAREPAGTAPDAPGFAGAAACGAAWGGEVARFVAGDARFRK